MDKVDLTKVKKLRQTYSVDFANQLIAAGYELIATASGQDDQGGPLLNYSLAWFKDEAPPVM
ncbi:hypothetical protein ACTOWA_00180 [Herbaspirillum seropedicae]|uniref:hypothetical protein n=1 Tax=Herbaspirillum seropedicae TaxID=964 RepID=UPI002866F4EB|nr:hypothetical protein [Herbaspirillum seropedicae]MDR6397995.1 hypothetical protein [Herbaspirillum seropedicae]